MATVTRMEGGHGLGFVGVLLGVLLGGSVFTVRDFRVARVYVLGGLRALLVVDNDGGVERGSTRERFRYVCRAWPDFGSR